MPSIKKDLTEVPRKELHVFYVLDTSGSMEGASISSLNHAMEECTEALQTIAKSNADAQLKIAVLEFNSGFKWITHNGPEHMDDFQWDYLKAGGITDIGKALAELDNKLSKDGFLKSMTGAFMPVIIFMTDGYATDDYGKSLSQIRQNKWFKHSTKIGFAIGSDPDTSMIASIVGNSEAVIRTTDLDLFKRLMKFVTVTASVMVSKTTISTDASGSSIIQDAINELNLNKNITPDLSDDEYDKEIVDNTDDDDWGSADDDW